MGSNPLKHQARPLVFVSTEQGCFVPISHALNPDGYFRKKWGNARYGNHVAEMFHRFIWRAHGNSIPDGHEIDHKCKNRACCNVKHLQCIPGGQHASESNRDRKGFRSWGPHAA